MWTTNEMPGQSGKTIIITGANAGIGYETAKALYQAGATVTLACRDNKKAQTAADSLMASGGSGTLEVAELDLGDYKSIQTFAEQFSEKHSKLDVLINNAGVMIPPLSHTADGFELQFGVNFLGHFALTGYLYPLLNATPGSRIVTVSSLAYLHGVIDFDNLKAERDYDAMREYRQSKLANVMFSLELQRRIDAKGDQVLSLAAQPGANNTELSRHMEQEAYQTAVERVGGLMEPWQGALPSLYAATVPDVSPKFLYSPHEQGGYRGYPVPMAFEPHALDETVAAHLFDLAVDVTGVNFPG